MNDNASHMMPVSSDWSQGLPVRVAAQDRWLLQEADMYDEQGLIALQRSLVRLSAARGDLFAVLALPEHYHQDDAIAHILRLKSLVQPVFLQTASGPNGDDVRLVFPLGYGERSAFSYAGLYYPWLNVSRDTLQFINIPPDGAACGIIALRALARGAWIAPANERLSGVLDLTPAVSSVNWQRLQDAQVNLIRNEPRGFLCLNADTLCDEEDGDLRPINVRRLLILLRRLALRLGATYVFEPNSPAFQRLVQRGFEFMMDQMFARGAFAGSTPDTSFQVVTDASLNTPQSMDLGRFIVDLKVAPSLPMTFITVRLVQSATGGSVTEMS
jgi:phage tail sheath protein FI